MSAQPAKSQNVIEVYELLLSAATRRQPVAAIYDGLPRLLCPHVLGRKQSRLHALVYQFGGDSHSGLPVTPERLAFGVVLRSRNSARSNSVAANGTPSRARRGRPALMKWISMSTLSPEKIRKKGSEAVAAATSAPE